MLDPSIPLDVTVVTDPFGTQSFPNLAPAFGAGISGTVTSATPFGADVEVFIDTTTSGTSNFDLVSGAPGDAGDAHFPLPGGLNVAQRTPQPLAAGATATGTVTGKYATTLFAYTPPSAAPAILDFHAATTATGGFPPVILLPASGRWGDVLIGGAAPTWLSTSTDPIYGVYFDQAARRARTRSAST